VTKQEHDLMLTLFSTQMQLVGTVLEILHSRDIAGPDDIQPFAALAMDQAHVHAGKFLEAYCEAAKRCGVALPEGFAATS
jgi:hypothetical protein